MVTPNENLMFVHRLRRCPNIERLVFVGISGVSRKTRHIVPMLGHRLRRNIGQHVSCLLVWHTFIFQPALPGTSWATHQKQETDPMLVQCWATVYDAGPTLAQHRVRVSWLMATTGRCVISTWHACVRVNVWGWDRIYLCPVKIKAGCAD